jgi:acyl-CoA synthetase (AMP-forming)/AMP-acid ligase II
MGYVTHIWCTAYPVAIGAVVDVRFEVVEFIDEILKTPSGKILRCVLGERDRAAVAST